ncbi:MAG: hypothetical protein HDR11_00860 [Lachnospiraceae bacterium]|nr:hypothetical protein [Lachnospiraceae bacterium]
MKNKVHRRDYFLVFFLTFIIRIWGFILNGRLMLIADEMGMLVSAASLAGRDWSGITLSYYGFGYAVFLTPIFLLTNNPYVIYWSIMAIGAALLSLSVVIGYHILRKYLGIENRIYAILASISCSMLALTDMRCINNEPMIVLLCWSLLWLIFLLVKYHNCEKQNVKYTILVIILLTYALTVHSRLMVLWSAFVFLIIIYYIFYKRILVSLKIGLPFGIFSFIAVLKVISFVQTCFWKTDENGYLHNSISSTSEGMVSKITSLLQSTDSWNAVFNIAMGNLCTSLFFTSGMICFCGVVLYKFIKSHVSRSDSFWEKIKPNQGVNRMIEAGSIFFGVAFFITLAGLMVQWGELVAKGQALGYGADTSATKVFVYIRYYSCYISVVLLMFFAFIYHNKNILKKYMARVWLVFAFMHSYWFLGIVPYIQTSSIGLTVFGSYGFYTLHDTVTSLNLYLICGVLLLALFAGVCICYKKGKILTPIILMLLLIVFRYYYNGIFLNETNGHKANAGYRFVKGMEDEIELPLTFYLRLPYTNCLAYQFFLNEYIMIPSNDFPVELEYGIVITSVMKEQEQRYESGFLCIYLDENEYMWVKGEDLQRQMMEYGVMFLELSD